MCVIAPVVVAVAGFAQSFVASPNTDSFCLHWSFGVAAKAQQSLAGRNNIKWIFVPIFCCCYNNRFCGEFYLVLCDTNSSAFDSTSHRMNVWCPCACVCVYSTFMVCNVCERHSVCVVQVQFQLLIKTSPFFAFCGRCHRRRHRHVHFEFHTILVSHWN